jgi:hypothetical protein
MKYNRIIGSKVEMSRDMQQRFNRIVIEKSFHFPTTIRLIQSSDIIPVDFISSQYAQESTLSSVFVVLVEHFQAKF